MTALLLLVFCLSGCALDSTVIKWHDGKTIRLEGNAKTLVKVKLGDGEVEVDRRRPSALRDFMQLMMLKMVGDTKAEVNQ